MKQKSQGRTQEVTRQNPACGLNKSLSIYFYSALQLVFCFGICVPIFSGTFLNMFLQSLGLSPKVVICLVTCVRP